MLYSKRVKTKHKFKIEVSCAFNGLGTEESRIIVKVSSCFPLALVRMDYCVNRTRGILLWTGC